MENKLVVIRRNEFLLLLTLGDKIYEVLKILHRKRGLNFEKPFRAWFDDCGNYLAQNKENSEEGE
jgi:hypothetical protein